MSFSTRRNVFFFITLVTNRRLGLESSPSYAERCKRLLWSVSPPGHHLAKYCHRLLQSVFSWFPKGIAVRLYPLRIVNKVRAILTARNMICGVMNGTYVTPLIWTGLIMDYSESIFNKHVMKIRYVCTVDLQCYPSKRKSDELECVPESLSGWLSRQDRQQTVRV